MENVDFESTSVRSSRGSRLAKLSLEAGASSAFRSRAGVLERELTASFQAAWSKSDSRNFRKREHLSQETGLT